MNHEIVYAVNSPFDRDVFKRREADRWLRQGKAIELKRLCANEPVFIKFLSAFTLLIQRQAEDQQRQVLEDKNYEDQIDLQRSGGRAVGSHATWGGRRSGGMNVMQMKRVWPIKKRKRG